jgi:hypothetical protein
MKQVLTALDGQEMCSRFHIVYYLKSDLNPVLTGVNYEAKNMVEALLNFVKDHPEKQDQILYVIKTEKL